MRKENYRNPKEQSQFRRKKKKEKKKDERNNNHTLKFKHAHKIVKKKTSKLSPIHHILYITDKMLIWNPISNAKNVF